MNFLYVKYAVYSLIIVIINLLAFLLAPVASLPIFINTDENGREHIKGVWKWITTHDAPIDIYMYAPGSADHWYLGRYTKEEILASAFKRYLARVFWIWRNPAYQVAHWLGYSQIGVVYNKHSESESTWDTGLPSYAYWTAVNAEGGRAFLWERQIYFYKNRCLELQFGWKLYRDDPDQICMLAFRITPFKKYGLAS